MTEFHNTKMEREFYEFTAPKIAKSLNGIQEELARANDLKERELNLNQNKADTQDETITPKTKSSEFNSTESRMLDAQIDESLTQMNSIVDRIKSTVNQIINSPSTTEPELEPEVDIIIGNNKNKNFRYIHIDVTESQETPYSVHTVNRLFEPHEISRALRIIGEDNLKQFITQYSTLTQAIAYATSDLTGDPEIMDLNSRRAMAHLLSHGGDYVIYSRVQTDED